MYAARKNSDSRGLYEGSDIVVIVTNATTGERAAVNVLPQPDGFYNAWHRIATSVDRTDPGGPNDGRTLVAAIKGFKGDGPRACFLYISVNTGRSFEIFNADFEPHGCSDLKVDSTGNKIIVLTEFSRVFLSEQGGAPGSFRQLADFDAASNRLAATPDLQRVIVTSAERCAMISDDGGQTWRKLWDGGKEECNAVAMDASGGRVLITLYSAKGGVGWYLSSEGGENLKEPRDAIGLFSDATMDDYGKVVFVADERSDWEDAAVNVGDGHNFAALDTNKQGCSVARCSVLDRCMTLAVGTNRGLVLAKKKRNCLIRDDPFCALTDESLAKPDDWFLFSRVSLGIDVYADYAAFSTISASADGMTAYTLSARDHQIFVLSGSGQTSLRVPAKRTDDGSEWRSVATNALVSNPGTSLDGHFYAACTSDGTVYVASTYRYWDDVNGDIKLGTSGAAGASACTHIQLSSDASYVAVLTDKSELWVANITKGDFSRLNLPAGSFRKVLSLTGETAHALTATPDFDSLVVTMSSSCALVSRDLGQTWQQPGGMGGSCLAATVASGGQKLIVADRGGSVLRQTTGLAYFSSDGGGGVAALPGTGIYTDATTETTGTVFIVAARDDVGDDWRKGTQMLFGDGRRWARQGPGLAARSVSCSEGDKCRTVWVATTDGIFVGKKTREHINPPSL